MSYSDIFDLSIMAIQQERTRKGLELLCEELRRLRESCENYEKRLKATQETSETWRKRVVVLEEDQRDRFEELARLRGLLSELRPVPNIQGEHTRSPQGYWLYEVQRCEWPEDRESAVEVPRD